MKSEIISFYTGLYSEDCADGYDCISWASEKAYLDMNRTMTFKDEGKGCEKKRIEWRREGTEIIRKGIDRITEGDYDKIHKDICDDLMNVYEYKLVIRRGGKRTDLPTTLTYGQAQKWVNMTLKYLWTLVRLDVLKGDVACRITACEKKLHVPLDSYILRYASGEKMGASPQNGLKATIKSVGDWSKLNNYNAYIGYQMEIREKINDGAFPMEWELKHWHKAIKLYD